MLLNSIITSILSTAFLVTLIEYFFKKSYEKLLDRKLESFKEEIRQKSKIHDSQFTIFHELNSMVYRARNKVRDINDLLKGNPIDHNSINDHSRSLNAYTNAIAEILYENRILLTEDIFNQIHGLKNSLSAIEKTLPRLRISIINDNKNEIENFRKEFISQYQKINNFYNDITDTTQKSIKVK